MKGSFDIVRKPPATGEGLPLERRQSDRRRAPTPMLAAFTSPGRRRGYRRTGEEACAYVDRPSHRVVAWALAVMGLCALDALLTLFHIEAGGRELVPTMRMALHHGETTFVATKMGITALGVFILSLHQNFPLARLGYRALLAAYLLLTAYHVFLIASR